MNLLIPDAVVESIWSHVRGRRDGREQGGLLLGYRKPGAIQIDSVTFPGRWDHASATLFRRSERSHRVRALREWMRSGRTIDWIGEWHTHPGGVARPSFIDRRNWVYLAKHIGRPVVFLIFDDARMYVGLQAVHPARLAELQVVERGSAARLYG